MELSGKVALIPGASRPIGRAIARKFIAHGAMVVLPYFDWPESVLEMKGEFSDAASTTLFLKTDLRDEEQVKKLLTKTKNTFGKLDFLINNIERGGMPIVHGNYDLPHNNEQWDLEISTTLKAKWLLFHTFLNLLKDTKSGAVVNISSISAITGRSGPASLFFNDAYSAANRAITSFTETWAREGAPNVRVNELQLGLVQGRHGENTRGWETMNRNEKESLLARTLLERTASVEEVADTVYFLAQHATYITGSCIRMDGGYTLGGDRVPSYPPGIL